MNRRYFWIVLAISAFCIFLIIYSMWSEDESPPLAVDVSSLNPMSPYKTYISGVGVVEASSENIMIGSPLNRVVEKIKVNVGQEVKKGDVLFVLESRDLQGDLLMKQVAYENALAKFYKLEDLPRKEDVMAADAMVKNAEAELGLTKSQYEMVMGLKDSKAISQEEKNRRHFAYKQAEAKVDQAKADFEKTKNGTWKPDLEIARLEVIQAKTNVDRAKIDIERTIILSPISGKVLQIRIHEGELAPQDSSRTPMMIIGNTHSLNLRVNINQYDAPYYDKNEPAVAFLQGDARFKFPLKFVELEPYLVNKQNLTNDIMEKVDTRVLEVIYKIEKNDSHIYVGQQMDVFIKTDYSL